MSPLTVRGRHRAPRILRRTAALVCGVVAFAGVGGTSYAYYQALGSGSGSGTAATPAGLTTLDVSGSTSGVLTPGGSAALVVKVHNPNSWPVEVTGIAWTGALPTVTGALGTCTGSALSVGSIAVTPFTVAAGADSALKTYAGAVTLAADAADGCQNARFAIPLTVTGTI